MKPLRALRRTPSELTHGARGIFRHFFWSPDDQRTVVSLLEGHARRRPDAPFLWFEGRQWTWGAFGAAVNRHAHAWRAAGIGKGDVVAVVMDNRPAYLFHVYGLATLGAVPALVNHNLTGHALVHAITAARASAVLAGDTRAAAVAEVAGELAHLTIAPPIPAQRLFIDVEGGASTPADGAPLVSWSRQLEGRPESDPGTSSHLRLGDTLAYIYTSGTTGLPKAAVIKHHRFWRIGHGLAGVARIIPSDCIYLALPLYHTNGIGLGVSMAIVTGCRLHLARRFSARRFWEDCAQSGATASIYIGEICRYLLARPPSAADRGHQVRTLMGNGLRSDVWGAFVERFGVERIVEFYGATEGNANTVNVFGTPGSCGLLFPGRMALVRCDASTGEIERDARGRALRVKPSEPGVLLGRIRPSNDFDGYTSAAAGASKVLRDVFSTGDASFNTGDLLRRDHLRRLYFVDRLGDTFRWKGENVSTQEVGSALASAPGVEEVSVYGVAIPGTDGRAGMAAIVPSSGRAGFNPAAFAAHAAESLPAYARPCFVRLVREMTVTGTFKHRKRDLVDEGWEPESIEDPVLVFDAATATYVPLTRELAADIVAGRVRL